METKTCKNCRFFDEQVLTTERAQITVYKCDWHMFVGRTFPAFLASPSMYQKDLDEYGVHTFCNEKRWKNKDLEFTEKHQVVIDSVIASLVGLIAGFVLSKI